MNPPGVRAPRRRRDDRVWVGICVAVFDVAAAGAFVLAGVSAVDPRAIGADTVPRVLACLICCVGGGLLHLFARIAAAWLRIYKREAGVELMIETMEAGERAQPPRAG